MEKCKKCGLFIKPENKYGGDISTEKIKEYLRKPYNNLRDKGSTLEELIKISK